MIETMLAALTDWFTWWQGVLLIVLIALIIFYVSYRRRQM
jgi:type II secretory pathway component PulF